MNDEYYQIPLDFEELLQKGHLPRCSVRESVAQHLYIMLTTYFGESRFDYSFGCGVWDQDFEVMTTIKWKDELQRSIEQVIKSREPRLSNIKVQVWVEDFEIRDVKRRIRKRLEVGITSVLSRTNEAFSFKADLFIAPLAVD